MRQMLKTRKTKKKKPKKKKKKKKKNPVKRLLKRRLMNKKVQLLKEPAMEKIKGIVVPTGWDSNGNVISLSIATGNEQEYLIENHRQIANLWTLLRQEVVVIGSIKSRKEHMIIKVAKIQRGKMNNPY
jgi:hypothetical protein